MKIWQSHFSYCGSGHTYFVGLEAIFENDDDGISICLYTISGCFLCHHILLFTSFQLLHPLLAPGNLSPGDATGEVFYFILLYSTLLWPLHVAQFQEGFCSKSRSTQCWSFGKNNRKLNPLNRSASRTKKNLKFHLQTLPPYKQMKS